MAVTGARTVAAAAGDLNPGLSELDCLELGQRAQPTGQWTTEQGTDSGAAAGPGHAAPPEWINPLRSNGG